MASKFKIAGLTRRAGMVPARSDPAVQKDEGLWILRRIKN